MPYTPILATLGYVLSPDGRQVLLVHRNANANDYHFGRFNGLGGKLEAGEDIVAGKQREIREEAGIECLALELRGTVNWPGFGKHGEDWFGFIFQITEYEGVPLERNPEGELVWIDLNGVAKLNLWEGDRYFLPLVFEPNSRPFHGVMPYRDGKPTGWTYSSL